MDMCRERLTRLCAKDIAWCAVLAVAAFAIFMVAKSRVVPGIDGPVTFDGHYYLSIYEEGYSFDGNIEDKQNTAFLPLTGVIVGLATLAGPGRHELLEVAILGMIALFGTLLGLVRLAGEEHPGAGRAVTLLWAASPMALYNFVGYSEPLFALIAVWAFVALRSGAWWTASLLAGLAMLCRPSASVLVLFVALAILQRESWSPMRVLRSAATPQLCLLVIPLMAFASWLTMKFGDSTLYVNSLEAWRRGSFHDGSLPAPQAFQYFLEAVSAESKAVSHWTTLLTGMCVAIGCVGIASAVLLPRIEGLFYAASLAFLFLTASFDALNIARHTLFMFPWALLAGIAVSRGPVNAGIAKYLALLPWLAVATAINIHAIGRYYRGEWVS